MYFSIELNNMHSLCCKIPENHLILTFISILKSQIVSYSAILNSKILKPGCYDTGDCIVLINGC